MSTPLLWIQKILWCGVRLATKNGNFSVKSFYSSLAFRRVQMFPFRIIWSLWLPLKISIFFFLRWMEEAVDNILLHCSKAQFLRHLIFALFGVQWVLHSIIRGVFLS